MDLSIVSWRHFQGRPDCSHPYVSLFPPLIAAVGKLSENKADQCDEPGFITREGLAHVKISERRSENSPVYGGEFASIDHSGKIVFKYTG